MTPTYRQDNEHFQYNNANPKNSKSSGDCVVRAISVGLDKPWDEVFQELCKLGLKMKAMPNDNKVFRTYLKNQGYTQQKQPRKGDNTKYTIKEFIRTQVNRSEVYIVVTAGHLTCIKHGKIQDTWDCGRTCVGNYWRIR